MNDCVLCLVLQQFDGVTVPFAQRVFTWLAVPANELFRMFLTLWFVAQGVFAVTDPRSGPELIRNFIKKSLAFIVVIALISNYQIVWRYFFEPAQQLSVAAAMTIIEAGSSLGGGAGPSKLLTPPGNVSGSYAKLFGMAEMQFFEIIKTAYNYMESRNLLSSIAAAATGFILWFLFGLVLLVFGFFLIEAQFYFLAVGALAPILIISWAFEPTRKYAQAGISMIVLAAASIVTAALAMGFTVGVIERYSAELICALDNSRCTAGLVPKKIVEILSIMLLIGFISLLLHIKSKTLASSFSGVMDSAAPATLVALGAKAASVGTIGAVGQLLGARRLRQAADDFLSRGGLGGMALGAGWKTANAAGDTVVRAGRDFWRRRGGIEE